MVAQGGGSRGSVPARAAILACVSFSGILIVSSLRVGSADHRLGARVRASGWSRETPLVVAAAGVG